MKKQIVLATTFALVLSSLYCPESQAAAKPKLSKTKLTLTVGKTAKLKVKNYKGTVKWSSNKKKVAAVSKKGVVTAKKKGTAVITAKAGKKKLKCKVTVKMAANKNTQTPDPVTTASAAPAITPGNNKWIHIIYKSGSYTENSGDSCAHKRSYKKESCSGTSFETNDRKAERRRGNDTDRFE